MRHFRRFGLAGDTRNSAAPISPSDQQLAEGADLGCDEVTERAHARFAPHIAMDKEIKRQSKIGYLIEQANQIRLVLCGDHRERRDARS